MVWTTTYGISLNFQRPTEVQRLVPPSLRGHLLACGWCRTCWSVFFACVFFHFIFLFRVGVMLGTALSCYWAISPAFLFLSCKRWPPAQCLMFSVTCRVRKYAMTSAPNPHLAKFVGSSSSYNTPSQIPISTPLFLFFIIINSNQIWTVCVNIISIPL